MATPSSKHVHRIDARIGLLIVPTLRVKAINIMILGAPSPSLALGLADAKLGLGAPSMAVFAFKAKRGFLNLMALTLRVGTQCLTAPAADVVARERLGRHSHAERGNDQKTTQPWHTPNSADN